ncbi:Uncharacterized protein APZ42_028900 [Daphnia magna]|uniref:Uncharacterized protein n=1 Tax=Daphnia magna TaxID=35525 RepID=A0A164Q1Y5_9CRUS|nr:Uncharacterized protein APZ42_028900 [Daphnia magna]
MFPFWTICIHFSSSTFGYSREPPNVTQNKPPMIECISEIIEQSTLASLKASVLTSVSTFATVDRGDIFIVISDIVEQFSSASVKASVSTSVSTSATVDTGDIFIGGKFKLIDHPIFLTNMVQLPAPPFRTFCFLHHEWHSLLQAVHPTRSLVV